MRDTYPERFDEVSYDNLQDAVKAVEDRLRYVEERSDFAIKSVGTTVCKAGSSPAQTLDRVQTLELAVADLRSAVNNLQTTANNLSQAKNAMQTKTGRIPPTQLTAGHTGQLYIDTLAQKLYFCEGYNSGHYIWHALT